MFLISVNRKVNQSYAFLHSQSKFQCQFYVSWIQGPHAQPMAFLCFTSLAGLSLYQHGQSISTSHVQSGIRVTQTYYLVYVPAPELHLLASEVGRLCMTTNGSWEVFLFILSALNTCPLFPFLFLLLHRPLHYEYSISFDRRTSAPQSCLYMQGLPLLIQFFY